MRPSTADTVPSQSHFSTSTLTIPPADAPQRPPGIASELVQGQHAENALHPSTSTLTTPSVDAPERPHVNEQAEEQASEKARKSPAGAHHFDGQDEAAIPEDSKKEAAERAADIDGWNEEPANPRNWTVGRKWRNVAIVSFYTFITPLASSMMAPGLPEIGEHYGITNPTIVALTLSIYILAWAIGPLFMGPLSEIYGRIWVLHLSNLFFMAFTLGCIFAPNTSSLIVFRFLAGLGGCTPVAIGGGCISDLFNDKERGTAMSIYTTGPLIGPVLGPIAGGFMVQSIGFKWVFILLTILAGVGALVAIPFLEETYAPVLQERLATRRGMEDEEKGGVKFEVPVKPALGETLRVNLSRPFLLLTRSFICFILSLFMSLIYGFLYLMFTTFPTLFSEIYGWGPGISGLAYLGPGIGFFIATGLGAPLMNRIYLTLCDRNDGKGKPEFRIPVMFLGSVLVPIGLFWYGWSAEKRLHWIMPILGSGIFSAGMMFVFIPIMLYLVDAFTFAASALAAASVFRALFGFAFPLFGEQMFAALGLGGGNSLLAGLAILTGVPFPIWIYYKGEAMRARNPLNR